MRAYLVASLLAVGLWLFPRLAFADAVALCAPSDVTRGLSEASEADLRAQDLSFAAPKRAAGAAVARVVRGAVTKRVGAITIKNLTIVGDLDLHDLVFAGQLLFENVRIEGALNLADADVRAVTLNDVVTTGAAQLDGMKVARSVEWTKGVACKGLHASRFDVAGDVAFTDVDVCDTAPEESKGPPAKSTGPSMTLSRSRIGGDVRFVRGTSECPFSVRSVRVGSRLIFDGTTFSGAALALELQAIDTAAGTFLLGTHVRGGWTISHLTGGFTGAQGAVFDGSTHLVDITSGSLFFGKTHFRGTVHIAASTVNAFEIREAEFDKDTEFVANKSLSGFALQNSSFREHLDVIGMEVGTLFVVGSTKFYCETNCQCEPEEVDCVPNQLTGVIAKSGLSVNSNTFDRPMLIAHVTQTSLLELTRNRVGAPLVLSSVHTSGAISLYDSEILASLTMLDTKAPQMVFEAVKWKVGREHIHMSGVDFERLDFGPGDAQFDRLFEFVDHVGFNKQIYRSAASFLEREGRADLSRELLLKSHRRALAEGPKAAGGYTRYVWKWILYLSIGGGDAPERAFFILSFFLLFGTRLYRERDRMIWRGRGDAPPYSPFWYTLDLLLPIIKLEDARDWFPLPHERVRMFVARVFRVTGFVLIPLLLASLTGLVK